MKPNMLAAFLLISLAPTPGRAVPLTCDCFGQTYTEGTVLKSGSRGDEGRYITGFWMQIKDFMCSDAAGNSFPCRERGLPPPKNCAAKSMFLGFYDLNLRGSKAKYLPEKTSLPPAKSRMAHYSQSPQYDWTSCGKDKGYDGREYLRYEIDTAFESVLRSFPESTVAAQAPAEIGSRPRPEDAVATSPQIDPSAAGVTAILVDSTTGEPVVDPDLPLNAELDRQLAEQGWNKAKLTHGFATGRIVAARKPLKLKIAKGKGSISLDEGQLGQVVSTGYSGASPNGAVPQVYVLWQKKRSGALSILKTAAMVAGVYWGGAGGAYALGRLLGGWQSFGEVKYVLAPADAADLVVIR